MALAALTGLSVYMLDSYPAASYAGLVLAAAGAGLAWRWDRVGLGLTIAAPLAAAALGQDPILAWNLAIFTAFLLCLRGWNPFLVGGLIGAVNYAATAWAVHAGYAPSGTPATWTGASDWLSVDALVAGGVAVAAAGIGSGVRAHRGYQAELARRNKETMALRDAETARALAEERLAIARDLHDLVGHQTAVLNLHLGAAEVHLFTDPAQAKQELEQARQSVRAVLGETQRILSVMRVGAGDNSAAGYDQLDGLVEEFQKAGLTVDATITTRPETLGRNTSRAAYRIVQEALTNAAKHGSGGVSLRVLSTDDGWLDVETVNVRADRTGESGHGLGLTGMRERAQSVGGTLDASADGSLFWLRARLPTSGGSQT
jgi:signal transduction histidine kinase